ncbi:outer envelope pore protein 16-4, chloroplastic-like [Chenopodium quinoa]|uniref:outer envelope pore protein 16-4, chloroplastic-like n=1 Tax=Chenopodium quinoa TaxID=63459 RepID=UPI000B775C67|nr:outer envelope pore protein 16-4, chloroplastic-like [Chenopodium quinoa]
MDTNIEKDTPCSSIAVESIVRIGTAGALWGLCSGSYDANKLGLAGYSRASFVAKSIGVTSFQCGMFAGVFSLTRCGIQSYRGREDVINAAAAGAIVGAAIAVGTRSKKEVAGMAALLSILGAAADYSRTL